MSGINNKRTQLCLRDKQHTKGVGLWETKRSIRDLKITHKGVGVS